MNLYKLHNDPKSLHAHDNPATQQYVNLSMLYKDQHRDPDNNQKRDLFLGYIKKHINDKNMVQQFSKLLSTEFRETAIWIIFQLSDSILKKMQNLPKLKK